MIQQVFLSWGPPHGPYKLAPEKYQKQFRPGAIQLRPNVPAAKAKTARKDLIGYYAHIIALDEYVGDLLKTIDEAGIADNTIFVFTSDHGDLLGSHAQQKKQQPYDESCLVPFLVRYLLGLCGLEIPESVEGTDYSRVLAGEAKPENEAALIECITPHGNWSRRQGGREYRGIRTRRYTYVRDLDGPWLLFDNENDPYQMKNLVNSPEHKSLQKRLDKVLADKLRDRKDEFLHGDEYIKRWGYKLDSKGRILHPE
jgi:arylsulfatase A-like enzyme